MRFLLFGLFIHLGLFISVGSAFAKTTATDERITLARFHMQEVTPKDARYCHKKLRKLEFSKEGYRVNGHGGYLAYEIVSLVPLIWKDLNDRAKMASKKHETMLINGEFVRSYASPEYSGLYTSEAGLSKQMICVKLGVATVARLGIIEHDHPQFSKPHPDPEQERFRKLGESRITAGYSSLLSISPSEVCDCLAYAQVNFFERSRGTQLMEYLIWVNLLQQQISNGALSPDDMSMHSSVWEDLSKSGRDAAVANPNWGDVNKRCADLSATAINAAKEVSIK